MAFSRFWPARLQVCTTRPTVSRIVRMFYSPVVLDDGRMVEYVHCGGIGGHIMSVSEEFVMLLSHGKVHQRISSRAGGLHNKDWTMCQMLDKRSSIERNKTIIAKITEDRPVSLSRDGSCLGCRVLT